jgi:hypothetical protein
MPEGPDDLDRRTVLKAIGASAAATAGLAALTGGAAADAAAKQALADTYADEESLRTAFEAHGGDLRDALVAEGVVSSDFAFGDLELDVRADRDGVEAAATDGLAAVTGAHVDGTTTAFGVASTSSDTHEVRLVVQPQRGEAYAFVEPHGSDDRVLVSGDGVAPASCQYDRCKECCDTDTAAEYQYYCTDDYCENCYLDEIKCQCSDSTC